MDANNYNKYSNLLSFTKHFSTDAICRQHLEASRWGDTPCCPHCGGVGAYKLKDEKTYKCKLKECHKKFTATVGTIFENSNLPLTTWFAAMYLITAHKKGISSHQLGRDLDLTQKTAWFVLQRIREMLNENEPSLLSGVVEVDEVYIGGKNKNRHQHKKSSSSTGRSLKDKTPVVGALERGGKVRAKVIPNSKIEHIHPFILDNIQKGSTMVTDEYRVYDKIASHSYTHHVVKHNSGEYVNGIAHTNGLEGYWSLLKRGIIGIYHQVSPDHLHRYCGEFAFRYNSRGITGGERFDLALRNVNRRLTYSTLTGK